MGNIQKATEDVVNLFEEVREKTTIPHWIVFEVLSNEKQKELYKISKSNEVVEILTSGVNFAVIFNEEILEGLPQEMQEMAIIECLAGVSVSDSDVVSLEKPDFCTHSGVLQKYGFQEMIKLGESVKSLYDVKKEREDKEKAATAGKRKKNSN